MAITRATGRTYVRTLALGLPEELWILVLARLSAAEIGRALCASRAFASVSEDVWRAACELRWPRWTAAATVPGVCWKRQYEMLELRERELGTAADVLAITRTQTVIRPHHRTVLTEWLAEVSNVTVCGHRAEDAGQNWPARFFQHNT